ncbi:MAG: transcriptional repressor [Proteobacteria bacterium]|nr:transcriptional repressor [Pseudomonadota bacterium]
MHYTSLMPDSAAILEKLRKDGFRLTQTRKAVVGLFLTGASDSSGPAGPMTAPELLLALEALGVSVNKTTVYREIDFLMARKLLREVHLGDGVRRYEYLEGGHHHHLVCVECNNIECFEMTGCLKEFEAQITSERNFRFIKHSLEFFGVCGQCTVSSELGGSEVKESVESTL